MSAGMEAAQAVEHGVDDHVPQAVHNFWLYVTSFGSDKWKTVERSFDTLATEHGKLDDKLQALGDELANLVYVIRCCLARHSLTMLKIGWLKSLGLFRLAAGCHGRDRCTCVFWFPVCGGARDRFLRAWENSRLNELVLSKCTSCVSNMAVTHSTATVDVLVCF